MASSRFCSVLSLALFLLLLSHANSSNDISFNFDRFNETNLILQGNATVSSSGPLLLTNVKSNGEPTEDSMGRAFFSAPIKIWDSRTGKVANFSTHFTFRIRANNEPNSAYGLAFALVPVGSEPKSKGRYLGLFEKPYVDPEAQTVAVVLGTLVSNTYPKDRHIGIHVNSIDSINTTRWDFFSETDAEVHISYDSSTKLLAVSLYYPSRASRLTYIVSARVELEKVLPEWVSVGFSATSGSSEESSETHDVLYWSFSSHLPSEWEKQPEDSNLANIVLNKIL
uniref:Alpha-amylase inhibiotr AI-Pa1L n=1 Tax=Phaseolus acutifolius TaxID=33129 RepID=Q8VX17_PHAAT|nr:alpha-amylase inhibiotr AI-Pa1L [Phaseolus acutifolius]BAE16274.1 alpha-amylase inhibitor [Phaseolus acutifolius]